MSVAILVFLALLGIAAVVNITSITPQTTTNEVLASDETRRLDRQAARQRYLNR